MHVRMPYVLIKELTYLLTFTRLQIRSSSSFASFKKRIIFHEPSLSFTTTTPSPDP